MASTKISALGTGAPADKNDLHVLARGGTNKKIKTAELFQETLTRSAFATKSTAGDLIAGRTYRVTGCGASNNQTIHVLALGTNYWYNEVVLETGSGYVAAQYSDFTADPVYLRDNNGNTYTNYFAAPFAGTFAQTNWLNNDIDCATTIIGHDEALFVKDSKFISGTVNVEGKSIVNCEFYESVIDVGTASGSFFSLKSFESYLSFNGNENGVVIQDVNLLKAQIILTNQTNDSISIKNSTFKNCVVYIITTKAVDIEGLHIDGGNAETPAVYEINTDYQDQVLKKWAGFVVADGHTGSSTVQMRIVYSDGSNSPGTWDVNGIKLPPLSPVGTFLLSPAGDNLHVEEMTEANTYTNHKVRIKYFENNLLEELEFTFHGNTTVTSTDQLIEYYGRHNNIGRPLSHAADFLDFRSQYNIDAAAPCWFLEYGAKYRTSGS